MRQLYAFLLLPIAVLSAQAGVVGAAAREVPRIILPGAPFGQTTGPALMLPPTATLLTVSAPPSLIIPESPILQAPAPAIIIAGRALTELEAAPEKMPSQAELKQLAESLSPAVDAESGGGSTAERARALDAAFDGALAPEAASWDDLSAEFSRAPLAPGLPVVASGARSLIARLLPNLYRRVPVLARYDRGDNPATGHLWTPKQGHVIEIEPVRPDSSGNVPSAFGAPGQTFVQQKIEHLMEYAHEYFHVLFDSAVRRKENHPMHSVYAAMTEGFAVSGEQILAERLLEMAPALGLGPRDAMDLSAISRGRRQWLDVEDNHYSEGILSWRKAYGDGGVQGMLSFMASLSARRMIAVPRSDSAYQLVLGDPQLLSAYLGRDQESPVRRGLEAFAKAASGEELTDAETSEAVSAVERAGPDGWRRLFERTMFADKRIKEPAAPQAGNWWETKAEPTPSVEPVFALARLSPAAGTAIAGYLADAISTPSGAMRMFERSGPNEKLNAIIAGAESLPWDEAGRKAWNDGLTRWLIGTN